MTIRLGADLFVSALTAPSRAASGSTISVTDTIKNFGGGGSGPSTTAFYLSANMTFDAADTRLSGTARWRRSTPAPRAWAPTTVMLPAVDAGDVAPVAGADDAGEVAETQETNNSRQTTIYVGPDLLAARRQRTVHGDSGHHDDGDGHGQKHRRRRCGASTTRFYLSLNGTLDATDILLDGERTVPAIAVNGIRPGTAAMAIPAGLSGRYNLLAVADALGAVAESSEINNVSMRSITINP